MARVEYAKRMEPKASGNDAGEDKEVRGYIYKEGKF